MLGHGSDTTTARGWQGELWDSEEDTCHSLQDLLELLEMEEMEELEEEKRLMRRKVFERDVAM